MKRATALILLIVILLVSNGATEPGRVDTSGMQLMHTTAYHIHGITATGVKTRQGIAACNPHIGDVAVVYSTDGKYLGTYEITDTGGTEGLQNGTVIDVWKCNYTQCQSWMKLTGGKVYVQWIEGEG